MIRKIVFAIALLASLPTISLGKTSLLPSQCVDYRKAILDWQELASKPLGLLLINHGGRVSKEAKTWRQVGKHTAVAALYSLGWFAGRSWATNDFAEGRKEAKYVMSLYLTGMLVGYTHNAIFKLVDKGELPPWLQKSIDKAKTYRKSHPIAQQPDVDAKNN